MSNAVALYGFGGGGGTGGTLTVTAPAGVTVTIAKDGKEKTKVADASGVAVFKGLTTGEWTITITDGEQTSQPKTVTVTADYAVAMTFFAATINITYPAGSTCTATDGIITITAPDTSGEWACVVSNAGTWTITVVDKNWYDTVEITDNGQTAQVSLSKYYLYKDGEEYIQRTGGWKINNGRGGSFSSGTGTKTDTTITLKISKTSTSIQANTANPVDLTTATTIGIKLGSGSWANLQVGNSVTMGNGVLRVEGAGGSESILDVSTLTGSYYVAVQKFTSGSSYGTAVIEQVWLA